MINDKGGDVDPVGFVLRKGVVQNVAGDHEFLGVCLLAYAQELFGSVLFVETFLVFHEQIEDFELDLL